MKQIPLTDGLFAKVDDHDFEWLSQYQWRAQKCSNGRTYAVRDEIRHGHKVTIFMHEEIAQRMIREGKGWVLGRGDD